MTGHSACEHVAEPVTAATVDVPKFVLKHADTFAVLDNHGDIRPSSLGEEGVYHYNCRFLSGLTVRLCDRSLLLLGSDFRDDNLLLSVDLTNPDIEMPEGGELEKDTVHIRRTCFLHDGAMRSQFELRNYGLTEVNFDLSIDFAADFADIFEVRGVVREARGQLAPPHVSGSDCVQFQYTGLDEQVRQTRIRFEPAADELDESSARFRVYLQPGESKAIAMTALFDPATERTTAPFISHLRQATNEYERDAAKDTALHSTNEHFNDWLARSAADLHMLITETHHGPYVYAGIPWFSTPFGRDGILAALMFMWINPEPARGVLRYLAANQADEVDASRDVEPGKILHEFRYGEMAALDEVPYRRYYGSVDSTPLFIVLADAYYQHTADREMLHLLWPHVLRGLQWIEEYGDRDGDGFVEYLRQSENGIFSQGWKDSDDPIFHANGRIAEPPVALCEVQGYVYQAYQGTARMAEALGKDDLARDYLNKAAQLRERFEAAFWSDELNTYVIALDADKQPCKIRSSNAGHCLFSGIARPEHARAVAQTLFSKQMFSGWGIRTLAEGEPRYNPMAYHNGSVWPHDNALIAQGLARYNEKAKATQLLESHLELSKSIDLHRLPELVCGFPRVDAAGPTLYPVACSPQAWAASSVFMMLSAALGMEINAVRGHLTFRSPSLPPGLRRLTIEHLKVGEAELDLEIQRHRHDVSVNATRRTGHVRIAIHK